jgi:dCMP deaminase
MSQDWRPEWDETWMNIAKEFAQRSACIYYKVGAVIVKGNHMVGSGYSGPPRGIEHCEEVGCHKRDEFGKRLPPGSGQCRGSHAEINAIINAPGPKSDLEGAVIYCTIRPCLDCAKHLINAGIKEIVYLSDYDGDEFAFELLKKAGVKTRKLRRCEK